MASHKTTHSHWKDIVDDIAAVFAVAGYGNELYNTIASKKLVGKKANLVLQCGKCASSLYFAVDKLSSYHLSSSAQPAAIQCPDCGHSGNHHYKGVS